METPPRAALVAFAALFLAVVAPLGARNRLAPIECPFLPGLATPYAPLLPPAAPADPPPPAAPTLAARLGYPPRSKLLIIHGDDAGVAHSVDQAIESAFAVGAISSSSILVAAPWFPEIAAFAKSHPADDFGVHLDLTSEWKTLRWRGVGPQDQIPSLLDPQGYLWPDVTAVAAHAVPAQARRELRAQIERARAFGVPFTHFDTHMGAVFATPALAKIYLDLGREYHRPLLLRRIRPGDPPAYRRLAGLIAGDPNVFLGDVVQFSAGPVATFPARYAQVIRALRPGELTEIIVHPGFDTPELRAAMGDGAFGAAWRQADYNAFTSPALRRLLRNEGVHLVRWRQLEKLLR